MKEPNEKADELGETKPLEAIGSANVVEGEETQELRALTAEQIEQILNGKRPGHR